MAKRFTAQLFVSRLSAYTTDQSLRQLFSPFARLIKDQQIQRPKGFGFITFESKDDARKALKALNGKIINGRLIFVEAAKEVRSNNNKSEKGLKRTHKRHCHDKTTKGSSAKSSNERMYFLS